MNSADKICIHTYTHVNNHLHACVCKHNVAHHLYKVISLYSSFGWGHAFLGYNTSNSLRELLKCGLYRRQRGWVRFFGRFYKPCRWQERVPNYANAQSVSILCFGESQKKPNTFTATNENFNMRLLAVVCIGPGFKRRRVTETKNLNKNQSSKILIFPPCCKGGLLASIILFSLKKIGKLLSLYL